MVPPLRTAILALALAPMSAMAQSGACSPGALYANGVCWRVGGDVAAQFSTQSHAATTAPGSVLTSSRIDARVSVDARTQTELGPVRAYVSLRKRRGQP
jgi:hypothetical protein